MNESSVSASDAPVDDAALLDRLALIEAQPIAERAASFAAIHDELRRTLDAPLDRPS